MPDQQERKWKDMLRQLQKRANRPEKRLIRKQSAPDAAQSHTVRGEEKVLAGCGAVLHPETGGTGQRRISAHHDGRGAALAAMGA